MQDTPIKSNPESQASPPEPAAKKAPPKKENSHKHWNLENDDGGIAWLLMDRANTGTNSLSEEVLDELGEILDAVAASEPKGLIIGSAKDSGFIAGADVKEFVNLKDTETAVNLIRRGQSVFNKIEGHELSDCRRHQWLLSGRWIGTGSGLSLSGCG